MIWEHALSELRIKISFQPQTSKSTKLRVHVRPKHGGKNDLAYEPVDVHIGLRKTCRSIYSEMARLPYASNIIAFIDGYRVNDDLAMKRQLEGARGLYYENTIARWSEGAPPYQPLSTYLPGVKTVLVTDKAWMTVSFFEHMSQREQHEVPITWKQHIKQYNGQNIDIIFEDE
ncbi:hypothetical protein BDV96DRAFT_643816 [Lophiotrema nucula]|uniref:Uncharacterized protein n=1 Tax=Lophiotrema nucula TaxID=690887 RepID=A0A6A5ZH88_9PLEO|nr:hypothetical protein BDV96DRAFT_643816 [Lophiotrema nucula]